MVFSFFQFWKKTETKSKLPISEVPLFSALGPAEVELIESKIRRVEYKKGDIVYRIGEKAEAFYIILLGRFRVVNSKGDTLTVLSQGDYFGESSILLGRDHSATVEAKNDGLVLRIEKKDFQNLLGQIPSLSLHLSRTLGHRLTAGATRTEVSKTKIVSICDYGLEFEKTPFIQNLAGLLTAQSKKKIVVVGLESKNDDRFSERKADKLSLANFQVAASHEIEKLIQREQGNFYFLRVGNGVRGAEAEAGMSSLIAFLIDRFEFILLDLPAELGDIGLKALQQSDSIYFLVGEDHRYSSKAISFLREFRTSFGFTQDEIRFILCEQHETTPEMESVGLRDQDDFSVFMVLPFQKEVYSRRNSDALPFVLENSESPYSKAIRFLVRELTGKLVGLVLGSGAAFGFAHVGVLRVLERERIPIDIIAGSSIGALIGVMWAAGLDSKAQEQIALGLDRKSTFFKLIGFRDFSLPHHGFFKGDQVVRFFRTFLDRKTFRRLSIPVKVIATNVFSGEEVVFDEGDVVNAIRASISIPGIFRPTRFRKQYLMDGGVADPLPVKILNRYGVKKIIAVNVLSASEDHAQRQGFYESKKLQAEEALKKGSVWGKIWAMLRGRVEKRFRANIFNVLMNTIQFLEYGMAESSSAGADVVIHAVRTDSHWAEFYSASKFIQRGEETTIEKLAEIKRLVEEGS